MIGVFAYMVLMLVIGYVSSKRVKNMADYLVAGRRLPFYLAFATIFATWFGAGTCIGAAGTAYSEGFLGVIADPLGAGLSLILAGFFYVGLLRRLNLLTVTDVFGMYYGRGSEIFASLLMVPVYVGWLGSQMVALGYIWNALTGMDTLLGIAIGGLVVLIYTLCGGLWAVTLTDLVQFIILVGGLFILFPLVLGDIGGFSGLINSAPRNFWSLIPESKGYQNWVAYAGQWLIMGLGCVVGQDLIQRTLAARNESIAKWGSIWAGVGYLTIGLIPVLLGIAGRTLLPGLDNPEHVIQALAMKYLGPFVLSIFIGAILAAIMSSADSSLLAAVSLLTRNVVLRIWPAIGQGHNLALARVLTVVVALLSTLLALWFQNVYHLMVNSWATLFVGILVPVTAALYWKKANRPAAWASMVSGTLIWIGWIGVNRGFNFFQDLEGPLFYEAAIYGWLASIMSYLAVTFLRYRKIQPVRTAREFPVGGQIHGQDFGSGVSAS